MGSFDRHAHSDEPDRPDRPDAAADRPRPPRETEAPLAERLGPPNLTRAAAYESLYAKAQAQDAPFRERLAREEREKSAGSPESLAESTGKPAPPIDNPDRDPEAPRTYWTEVPRFFATWHRHLEQWPRSQDQRVDQAMEPHQRAKATESLTEIRQKEPDVSDNIKNIEKVNAQRGWLEGFGFRLKDEGRLVEKVTTSLETGSPDASVREIIQQIPDAIRYTFCLRANDYTTGCQDIKERLETCGYKMYYSKNSWAEPEYKGINTRWVTPQGQRFEVQFHTRESFHAKHDVTHKAYERLRNPATSSSERVELGAFQREVSSWIRIPRGVMQISDYKKEDF